jgi:hypothetical protein
MPSSKEFAYSKTTIRTAELALGLGRVSLPFQRLLGGSDSPAYRQLYWQSKPHLAREKMRTKTINGDPNAGKIPRSWRYAAVLAAEATDLQEVTEGRRVIPAVAYVAHDIVHVGLLPEDIGFGSIKDTDCVAAAQRLGKGKLIATGPSYWDVDDQILLTAQRIFVPNDRIANTELPTRYPGVPLF